MANIIPKDTHHLVMDFLNGDVAKSRDAQIKVLDMVTALFIEASPSPIKTAMNMLGMNVGGCRLPMVPMEAHNEAFLKSTLEAYGLLK